MVLRFIHVTFMLTILISKTTLQVHYINFLVWRGITDRRPNKVINSQGGNLVDLFFTRLKCRSILVLFRQLH